MATPLHADITDRIGAQTVGQIATAAAKALILYGRYVLSPGSELLTSRTRSNAQGDFIRRHMERDLGEKAYVRDDRSWVVFDLIGADVTVRAKVDAGGGSPTSIEASQMVLPFDEHALPERYDLTLTWDLRRGADEPYTLGLHCYTAGGQDVLGIDLLKHIAHDEIEAYREHVRTMFDDEAGDTIAEFGGRTVDPARRRRILAPVADRTQDDAS